MSVEPSKPRAGVSRRGLVVGGLAAVGVVTAGPIAFVAALLSSEGGRFAAGTRIADMDIGGLTAAKALARLDEIWAAYLANPVSFELNGRVWRPRAVDIGLTVDYRTPLQEAYLRDRSGGLFQRLAVRLDSEAGVYEPRVSFDPERLRAYLAAIAAGFDQPAIEADLELPPTGGVQVQPGQPGRVVDIEAAIQALGDLTQPGSPGRELHLRFREDQPAYTTAEAEAAIAVLSQMVSAPILLMHRTRGWVIEPAQIRTALRVDKRDGEFVPTLEFTRFNDLFQTIERTLSAESKQTVFEYDEASDRVLAFEPGHVGQRLDRPALERAILERVTATGDRRLEIPLILLNREWDFSSNPLGIRDLVAVGSSIYKGSPDYRQHNIGVGAQKLDGQIIRPGEVFSLTERLGPVTLKEGWVKGSVIIADKTEQEVGGGICQLSTTLFRTALEAGLPIEERWPHLYRVHYYEMGGYPIGIDATVFIPGVDLKFRNDYEHPIMLRSRIDSRLGLLDFELWGVRDGRVVELVDHSLRDWTDPPPDEAVVDSKEDPDFKKQVEWAKRGVQAAITRVVTYADGAQQRFTFRSNYVAWPNRFMVGIDVAKAEFPNAYNKWFDEHPDEAALWGVERIPGVPSDPDQPAG